MSTNVRDYIFNFFLILDITIIVDLMHVHILNEHLSSYIIMWVNKLLYFIVLLWQFCNCTHTSFLQH